MATDQSPYCQCFLKFLKKLYTIDYLIICTVMLYWTNINMVSEAKCQQKMLPYILLNEILTALNNKQTVGGIFCDLHKAFDCINHALLPEKIKFYGVSGKFYNLIKSYLDGRYQKVVLSHNKDIESAWEKIRQGEPQGSILGPIFFFNLYKWLAKPYIHWN